MLGKYLQVLLLLGISLGSLVTSGDIQCGDSDWLSKGYLTDSCYFCKNSTELKAWCTSYEGGDIIAPLACCEQGYGYDYRDVIPSEVYEEPTGETDSDEYDVYNYEYDTDIGEEYSGFDNYEDYEFPDPADLEGFYNYDSSDSDSDSEDFPGSDLNDDEFAGPITNEDIGRNLVLPLPGSLKDSGPIVSIPPSPVDFSTSADCFLADVLGNNYIDGLYEAQQQCVSDLKLKLREELNSFLEEVSDTKANFESFLAQHADELTQDELEEVRSQMAELDTKVTERSQSMGAQLQNPDCSDFSGIVREDALLLAVSQYRQVETQDETEAGNQLICVEDYLRGLQTEMEDCESQVLNVFQKILNPDQTELIYDQMCRNTDVESVKEIINAFFDEINYESTYPTPVVEPEYVPYGSADTADEMELRRTEISEELEQLQQELDQAATEKDIIFNDLVNVSDRRVYVEERLLELSQAGESDSGEGQRLSAKLPLLLAEEAKLKSELQIIHGLVEEIQEEMQILLSEELRLEMQLGIMPEQSEEEPTPEPDTAVDEFIDIMGPGPVIIEEIPTNTKSPDVAMVVDPVPEDTPIIDDYFILFTDKPSKGKHSRKLAYAIGALIGVMLLFGTLFVLLCIPLLVLVTRNKAKKVPYDKASLAEKDPALLLRQTGFENPIYKFYSETSSKEHN